MALNEMSTRPASSITACRCRSTAFVERVDFGRLGGAPGGDDFLRERLDRCPEAPGDKKASAFASEHAGNGAVDGAPRSLRTWLYRIATNRCLNALRSASRRPAKEWNTAGFQPPEPTRLGEVAWLEPFPDTLLEGVTDAPLGPDARYEQNESISLAFVTALQILPPRQLAVLVLRDVLGFQASEVADMPDASLESVNSALKRARTSMDARRRRLADREPPQASHSPSEEALVAKFVTAYEAADLEGVVALLTDVLMAMPPIPYEYQGRDIVAQFCAGFFGAGRRFDLVPTRANGQPALGAYLRTASGPRPGTALSPVSPSPGIESAP